MQGCSALHLLLDAVVEFVRNDLVAVVLAPDHVHALPRKRVPRQELRVHRRLGLGVYVKIGGTNSPAMCCGGGRLNKMAARLCLSGYEERVSTVQASSLVRTADRCSRAL